MQLLRNGNLSKALEVPPLSLEDCGDGLKTLKYMLKAATANEMQEACFPHIPNSIIEPHSLSIMQLSLCTQSIRKFCGSILIFNHTIHV